MSDAPLTAADLSAMRALLAPCPACRKSGEPCDAHTGSPKDIADALARALDSVERLTKALADAQQVILDVQRYGAAEIAKAKESAEQAEQQLQKERREFEEQEAACCPEDVGFSEYIRALEKKLERATAHEDTNRLHAVNIMRAVFGGEQAAASLSAEEVYAISLCVGWVLQVRALGDSDETFEHRKDYARQGMAGFCRVYGEGYHTKLADNARQASAGEVEKDATHTYGANENEPYGGHHVDEASR